MKHMNRWLALFMIMAVCCFCGCSKTEVSDVTEAAATEATEPETTVVATEEMEETLLPWENGGKQPAEYTWAEYEVLTVSQKEAFFDSFGSSVEFDAWMSRATGESEVEVMPWEDGGKQPQAYTWAEYEALTASQKEAFYDSFGSSVEFDNWVSRVTGVSEIETMPWEESGKQPKEYTWAEYKALTASQKEAFFESFESAAEFDSWKNRATASEEAMPWEKLGKQPEEYTLVEYEALTAQQKEAFFESFESAEDFDNWMKRVSGNSGTSASEKLPWEVGGKQPAEYTWAEYEALTVLQKEAFFDSFEDVSDFDAWLTANQN